MEMCVGRMEHPGGFHKASRFMRAMKVLVGRWRDRDDDEIQEKIESKGVNEANSGSCTQIIRRMFCRPQTRMIGLQIAVSLASV